MLRAPKVNKFTTKTINGLDLSGSETFPWQFFSLDSCHLGRRKVATAWVSDSQFEVEWLPLTFSSVISLLPLISNEW